MTDTIPPQELFPSDDRTRLARRPGLTWREARAHGMTRREYRQITADARIIRRYHETEGTPESEREPLPVHGEHIVEQALERTRRLMMVATKRRIDPKLNRIERVLAGLRASIRNASALPGRHRRPESGTTHTGADAVALVELSNRKIADDNAASLHHHRRHRVLMFAGLLAPWLDVIGLVAFATYVLDVDIFAPWQNWLDWTLGFAIVVGVGLASSFTAMHAGHAHNAGREAMADGHVHEAEDLFRLRNLWMVAVAVLAALLATTLFVRTRVALDGIDALTATVLALLAIAAAFGLLAIAYLGAAVDGSRVSRERDALTRSLRRDHQKQYAAKRRALLAIDTVNRFADRVRLHEAPTILEEGQSILLRARQRYERTRLQVADVAAVPADVPHRVIKQVGDSWQGELSTGVPGASTVALEPLLDRETRLRKLLDERDALQTQLDEIPEHPWTAIGSQD